MVSRGPNTWRLQHGWHWCARRDTGAARSGTRHPCTMQCSTPPFAHSCHAILSTKWSPTLDFRTSSWSGLVDPRADRGETWGPFAKIAIGGENRSQAQRTLVCIHDLWTYVMLCDTNATWNKYDAIILQCISAKFLINLQKCLRNRLYKNLLFVPWTYSRSTHRCWCSDETRLA